MRHGPPVRRRGSPWSWQSQPSCRTSPECWSAIIVHVSARCSSLFCDVAVADGGSAIQLAVVAWARVSRGDDGGFTGSRRSLCVPFLFAAPWCRARSHLACLVLTCALLRLASIVAHAFNSIWRGVSFGCNPPPFGWFPVAPGSRPYSFGMIVGVAADR